MTNSAALIAGVEAYSILGQAACREGAPKKMLVPKLRSLVLDIVALKIASERKLLSRKNRSEGDSFLTGGKITWKILAQELAELATSNSDGGDSNKANEGSLWPLPEFISEQVLQHAFISLSALASGQQVRVLGDIYQELLETPLSELVAKKERKQLRRSRRSRGQFFTPQPIVKNMVQLIAKGVRKGKDVPYICDPAMGSAHFLIELASQLSAGDPVFARYLAETRLFGVDSDPEVVRLAKISFWLEFSTPLVPFTATNHLRLGDSLVGSVWEPLPQENKVCQEFGLSAFAWYSHFPEIARKEGFDLIIGNPPYDVLTGFAANKHLESYAGYLRKSGMYNLALGGQLNLYRLFIERALCLLNANGRLSFVVPASILTDKVVAKLRRHLLLDAGLSYIEHFSEKEKSFNKVGQSIAIFLADRRKNKRKNISMCAAFGSGQNLQRAEQSISLKQLQELDAELLPLPIAEAKDWQLVSWLSQNIKGKFAQLATGGVGEVDQTVYSHLLRSSSGELLLRGCQLSAFKVDLERREEPQRYLDADIFLQEKGENSKCMQRVNQWRVAQLGIRNAQCRPRLVAAVVAPGVYLGNSLNYWLPVAGVPNFLLLAFLNSSLYDWRFRLTSSNNNINVYEIQSLPVPLELCSYFQRLESDFSQSKNQEIAGMLDELAKLISAVESATESDQDLVSLRQAIDNTVFDLFNLPELFRKWLGKKFAV